MKDYKPQTKRPRGKARGSTLVGIFIGLVLGLLVAVAIALYLSKMPIPFISKQAQQKPAPQADRELAESAKAVTPQGRGGDKRFDFYRILPGQEMPVSEKELQQQAAASKRPEVRKETYIIQAGAFQSPVEADTLKARLALLGLEATVEPAHLPDKGTLYRVRLGPYAQLDDINQVRQTLVENGVDASLVKLRD